MIEIKPTLFVFAGNNGSGKSTMRSIIGEKIGIETSIDPDSLTRKYRRFNAKNPEFQAGKEAINLINKYIVERKSFAMETTLSGKIATKQIKNAKNKGFEIIMFFFALNDINLNIERVRQRVMSGGHNIPKEDIIRREKRVKRNLLNIICFLDQLIVLDNSKNQARMVINYKHNANCFFIDPLPTWAKEVQETIKKIKTRHQ